MLALPDSPFSQFLGQFDILELTRIKVDPTVETTVGQDYGDNPHTGAWFGTATADDPDTAAFPGGLVIMPHFLRNGTVVWNDSQEHNFPHGTGFGDWKPTGGDGNGMQMVGVLQKFDVKVDNSFGGMIKVKYTGEVDPDNPDCMTGKVELVDFTADDIPLPSPDRKKVFHADPDDTGGESLGTFTFRVRRITASSTRLAEPSISWSQPAAIGYGAALSAAQLNATVSGGIPGSFRYAPSAGAVLSAGTHPLMVTFTPSDPASFATVTHTVRLTVARVPLIITADNKSRAPGVANPPLTASYAGFVNGESAADLNTPVSLSTTATVGSAAGTYPITPAGATDANYVITFVPGTLTVTNKIVPTITWSNPAPITYGAALAGAQLNATVTGGIAGAFRYTPAAGTRLSAGTHILSLLFVPDNPNRYATATKTVQQAVNKAQLRITADDKSRRIGEANPPLTATHSGFVNGDTAATLDSPVTLSTAADGNSGAGVYPIIASGAADENYRIRFRPGTLTRKSHTAELALTLQPIFADASSIRLHFFHCKLRLSSPFSTEFHFPFSPLPP